MRLVQDHRDIALHANGSDTGLPDHVKKQMVSGGTGSDLGQQWRTTFSSLKQTVAHAAFSAGIT